MSEFTYAAKERLKSVNDALTAKRLEQQAAHEACDAMSVDMSDAAQVEAYNTAFDAATALDGEVANLVTAASNLAGGIAHATPKARGGSAAEILFAHPGIEGFKNHVVSHVAAEVTGRDETIRRITAGLPMFAADATAEALTAIDQRLYPPVQIPVRAPGLLDLILVGSTDSDTVKYGVQSVRTSGAATRARRAAFGQATYTWTTASVTVESAGHYVKAPVETLNDQGQLRTLLDGQLSDDLLLKIDDLIYQGAGTGTDFEGIKTAVVADGYTYDQDTTNFGVLDAIRKGITKVQEQVYGEPNGIVMSPATWERAEIERAAYSATIKGEYLAGDPRSALAHSLWGVPVVVNALVADNEVLVGNFRRGATLWMRQGVTVEMTNSNEDDFKNNLVLIRAQLRAAFKTVQTKAFCVVTLY